MNIERLRALLVFECGNIIEPRLIEKLCAEMQKTAREAELEDLLRSACAIAERKGEGTAWERFIASAAKQGVNGVTARTYRALPGEAKFEADSSIAREITVNPDAIGSSAHDGGKRRPATRGIQPHD